jgi:hypothetical protein
MEAIIFGIWSLSIRYAQERSQLSRRGVGRVLSRQLVTGNDIHDYLLSFRPGTHPSGVRLNRGWIRAAGSSCVAF